MFAPLQLPGMLWENSREETWYWWLLQGSSFSVEVLNQTLPLVPFLPSVAAAEAGDQPEAAYSSTLYYLLSAVFGERLSVHETLDSAKKQSKPKSNPHEHTELVRCLLCEDKTLIMTRAARAALCCQCPVSSLKRQDS